MEYLDTCQGMMSCHHEYPQGHSAIVPQGLKRCKGCRNGGKGVRSLFPSVFVWYRPRTWAAIVSRIGSVGIWRQVLGEWEIGVKLVFLAGYNPALMSHRLLPFSTADCPADRARVHARPAPYACLAQQLQRGVQL
jgi:hypothetical protein